jgi:hypothetical protein
MNQKKAQIRYDGNQEEMMRTLLGKSFIANADCQNLFNVLLLNAVKTSKGKKLK